MWWHPGIVLAIVPVWKRGTGGGTCERDGGNETEIDEGMVLQYWCGIEGPSKAENLDIIDSYAGRSGNPIRTQRNVLEGSVMTSENSSGGASGQRHSYVIVSSSPIPNIHVSNYSPLRSVFVHLPLRCPYLSPMCVCVCVCVCVHAALDESISECVCDYACVYIHASVSFLCEDHCGFGPFSHFSSVCVCVCVCVCACSCTSNFTRASFQTVGGAFVWIPFPISYRYPVFFECPREQGYSGWKLSFSG